MKRKKAVGSWLLLASVLMLPGGGTVAIAADLSSSAAHAQQPSPPRPPQDDEFVPVKDLGSQEQLPATPLVIGAYAVAWIAVFVYLWSIWRRLSRVEEEIASLSRRAGPGAPPGAHQ